MRRIVLEETGEIGPDGSPAFNLNLEGYEHPLDVMQDLARATLSVVNDAVARRNAQREHQPQVAVARLGQGVPIVRNGR